MENLISKIQSKFGAEILKKEKNQVWVKIGDKKLPEFCSFAKKENFVFFSSLSAIDILEKNIMELVYHLWNEDKKITLNIKTGIGRENPKINSIAKIYSASQVYEREIHELFGIDFPGNQNLSELFLEGWEGPAPFLKDFDWREYVKGKYYDKDKENEKGYFQ